MPSSTTRSSNTRLPKPIEAQLKEYETRRHDYEAFGRLVAGFLEAEIHDKRGSRPALPFLHGVESRAKATESLRGKILRSLVGTTSGQNRQEITDIWKVNDLAAARVIFYFQDDMKWFLDFPFDILFGKETKDSVDNKCRNLDSFGYASVHFTVRCAPSSHFSNSLRADDRERFANLLCEVQVRTILQHAWAETAHDIIYKKAIEGPSPEKAERLFNAMAATLELLDERLVVLKHGETIVSKKPSTRPTRPEIAKWALENPEILNHHGEKYPYLLVHTGDLSEISLREDARMYDSSANFKIPNYKDLVWSHLLRCHKPFVTSLNSYDSTTVRVKSWDANSKTLELQPALYSDQVTTNHRNAQRFCLPSGQEVKDYAFDSGQLREFADSPLSNTLGVACSILTSDNYWVIGKRRAGLSVYGSRWSCPVSGAVEWRERGTWNPTTFQEWVVQSILLECEQEIGLRIEKQHVTYLGFAREVDRLGKPQVFFLLDLRSLPAPAHDVPTMKARYNIYRIDDEFSGLAFLKESDVHRSFAKGWRGFVELTNGEEPSMELLACLALADQHLYQG